VHPFRYIRPRSLADALGVLAQYGPEARVLAGGTDLLVRLRLGHVRPSVVLDVKGLVDLRGDVTIDGTVLRIGASAVITDVISDPRIRRHFPALVEAGRVVGSVQIRNRATFAGNICNASPAADTTPALLAYGAVVNLIGAAGPRRIPLAEFFVGPGQTVLATGEIVASIDVPMPSIPTGAAFGRVTRRRGVDLASINLCCVVTGSGETRFAYGAVGPRPFVVNDTSGTLTDPGATRAARDAALAQLNSHASPISDVRADRDYREAMLQVMSRRTLATAIDRLRTARDGNAPSESLDR
jgi:CO/xanthine dehydrogenase FAD-binding subunit